MVRIEIEIPRPWLTLFTLVLLVSGVFWWNVGWQPAGASSSKDTEEGVGGHVPKEIVEVAEKDGRKARAMQAVLAHREEILRYQIRLLEEQRHLLQGGIREEEYRASIALLTELLRERKIAEDRIRETLIQMWEAESHAGVIAPPLDGRFIHIDWPIEPELGVSAGFLDEAYEARFGMPHHAIDIPALQESIISAAADGTVEEVTENGLGYSWITVRHEGFATLYGHVSKGLVQPGEKVRRGDPIALSGGLPGTQGAGYLTTGPHLHFEVITDEGNIDPLLYLPSIAGLTIGDQE